MLDPSSSEDTGGESDQEVVREPRRTPAPSSDAEKRGHRGRSGIQQRQRPTPRAAATGKGAKESAASHEEEEKEEERKERERLQKEEQDRKMNLQIYVFVLRCIAYPFNAKQPTDMARRQQKVS